MGLSEKIDGLLDVGKLVANWFPAVFGCLRASQEQMAEKNACRAYLVLQAVNKRRKI